MITRPNAVPYPRAVTVDNQYTQAETSENNLLIASSNAFITNTAVLRPQRFPAHALNAESLSIQSTFAGQVFNDLLEFVITSRLRACSWVQSNSAEEVIGAQAANEGKHKVGECMRLRLWIKVSDLLLESR